MSAYTPVMAAATSVYAHPPIDGLRELLVLHAGTLGSFDPEAASSWEDDDLRRFRVASRRLRSLLGAGRLLLDESWARDLRDELAWIGRAAGKARDLDVLLASLRDAATHFEPGERFLLARPLQELAREREAARAEFMEALRSERFAVLLERLERELPVAPQGLSEATLSEIAAAAFRRLRKRARSLEPDAPDSDLHRLRLEVKRARYAAELATAEAGEPALRFVERAKRLQDVLGTHQDATVAEARVRQLLGGPQASRWAIPGGRLVEYEYARREAARAAWPGRWRRLEKTGRSVWGQTLKRMLSTSPSSTE